LPNWGGENQIRIMMLFPVQGIARKILSVRKSKSRGRRFGGGRFTGSGSEKKKRNGGTTLKDPGEGPGQTQSGKGKGVEVYNQRREKETSDGAWESAGGKGGGGVKKSLVPVELALITSKNRT